MLSLTDIFINLNVLFQFLCNVFIYDIKGLYHQFFILKLIDEIYMIENTIMYLQLKFFVFLGNQISKKYKS